MPEVVADHVVGLPAEKRDGRPREALQAGGSVPAPITIRGRPMSEQAVTACSIRL